MVGKNRNGTANGSALCGKSRDPASQPESLGKADMNTYRRPAWTWRPSSTAIKQKHGIFLANGAQQ